MMYHNGGLLGAGKTLWQLNPHFGVQVLLKVKKGSIWGLAHGAMVTVGVLYEYEFGLVAR